MQKKKKHLFDCKKTLILRDPSSLSLLESIFFFFKEVEKSRHRCREAMTLFAAAPVALKVL